VSKKSDFKAGMVVAKASQLLMAAGTDFGDCNIITRTEFIVHSTFFLSPLAVQLPINKLRLADDSISSKPNLTPLEIQQP
jgi:hypothetical protein